MHRPAVLSRNGEFGLTDLGQQGIEEWMAAHKCNGLCQGYKLKPYSKPKRLTTALVTQLSTAYRQY